ncbi:MAG: YihY/virulence factor BrkB family protein [Deltaproteobacteria bacterium]|nr:YihY/virulence factor BrkB family protein [Deltaproteobacteria bacterium]
MREKLDSIIAFLDTGIWFLPEKGLSRSKAVFLRALKILLLAVRGYRKDRCAIKASALTFYSVLSVVPVIAVFFGIAKGFGFDKKLQAQLLEKFSEQTDVLQKVFEFSDSMLAKTNGGGVAGIGVAFLLWSVVKVLGHIEDSFNDIWKVAKPRTFARKCTDYLSIVIVCPILFIMAGSLTVTMASRLKFIAGMLAQWGLPAAPILFLLEIIPFFMIWAVFAFVLIYMPNAKVRLQPGILAGVSAGTAYQVTQWVYITFQVGVAKTNAIYGSFAALPLFLMWIQLSWLILLMGSEISFAAQNVDTHGFPEGSEKVSPHHKKILSLLIARLVFRNFSAGEKPLTPSRIANALGMPILLVHRILAEFSAAELFSTVKTEDGEETAYQPARDIHGITVKTVLESLERSGSVNLPFLPDGDFRAVADILDAFGEVVGRSPENRPITEL